MCNSSFRQQPNPTIFNHCNHYDALQMAKENFWGDDNMPICHVQCTSCTLAMQY